MRPLFKKIPSIVIVAVTFYFIGRVLYNEWDKISGYDWTPDPLLCVLSVFLLVIAYIISSYGWTLVLRMLDVKISLKKGLSIYLLSIFGRYIPGGIWSALGRMYLCKGEGIPNSRSGMSILLEQAYPVVAACIVFVLSLFLWDSTDSLTKMIPLLILIPLFIVFLHPWPFLKIANPILSLLGKGQIDISLSFSNMLKLTGYYIIYWIVSGVAFYLFMQSFYSMELYLLPVLIGIYAASFAAGYIAFLAPAGLGVREGSLIFLLSFFMPASVAIGIAILSRLWIIGVELLILIVFLLNGETRRMAKTALRW